MNNARKILMNNPESVVINQTYKHYKGQHYKVLSIARHSETLEQLVVYQALYGAFDIWVRPLNMFLEMVVCNGKPCPRFEPLCV